MQRSQKPRSAGSQQSYSTAPTTRKGNPAAVILLIGSGHNAVNVFQLLQKTSLHFAPRGVSRPLPLLAHTMRALSFLPSYSKSPDMKFYYPDFNHLLRLSEN